MIPEFNEHDYLTEARENVTSQFKGKDVFDRYLQLLISGVNDIQNTIKQLIQNRSIDEATGEQLNIIGRIVGQERDLTTLDFYTFFAFKDYPNGGTFGDLNNPHLGAVFYSLGDILGSSVTLDDNTYRLFIKSKILKNKTASTPEELLQFLSFIFPSAPIFIEEGEAHITINIGRELSEFEENLLTYISYSSGYPSRFIPKTVGVGIDFASFEEGNFFAFDGVPGAQGFGDASGDPGYGEEWGESWGEGEEDDSGGVFASYV